MQSLNIFKYQCDKYQTWYAVQGPYSLTIFENILGLVLYFFPYT